MTKIHGAMTEIHFHRTGFDAVQAADDWYAVLADAHACGVCLDHTPDECETARKDEEGDDR